MSTPGGGEQQTFDKITDTVWPASCPSKNEETVMSIVCGNTHLGWALHLGIEGKFLPQLFWRTPALNNDEINTVDPCSILERYLPNGGHELIFGSQTAPANKNQAAKTASTRRIPLVSVYIVSTNPDNEAGVEFLFRDVPCRMFRLKASDFFTPEEGAYEGMGIDRLANMKAASKFYNYPIMVIDGGTAMTYTGANKNGHITGGGIYPGLAATYRSMHDYTGALPLVSQEELNRLVDDAVTNKKPLPTFATDTKTAMITTCLKGMAEVCWAAVDTFKEDVIKSKEEEKDKAASSADAMEVDGGAGGGENGDKKPDEAALATPASAKDTTVKDDDESKLFTICLTGGDGDIIGRLLETDHGHILTSHKTEEARMGIDIQKHKHLTHYGIGQVLDEKTSAGQALQSDEDRVREDIVGQRVAKKFIIRKENRTFRGSVAAVAAGKTMDEDWFYIRYDDGDTEHLTIVGLYDALLLYKEVGEENKEGTAPDKLKAKAEASEAVAKSLETQSAQVKKHSETPLGERKKQGPRKRNAQPTKQAPPEKKAKPRTPTKKQSPFSYIGQRIAKYFGEEVFFGTIKRYIEPASSEPDLWHVVYDDDDQEDYDAKDLRKAVALYKSKRSEDKMSQVSDIAGVDSENQAKPKPTKGGGDSGAMDVDEDEPEVAAPPAGEGDTTAGATDAAVMAAETPAPAPEGAGEEAPPPAEEAGAGAATAAEPPAEPPAEAAAEAAAAAEAPAAEAPAAPKEEPAAPSEGEVPPS